MESEALNQNQNQNHGHSTGTSFRRDETITITHADKIILIMRHELR